MKFLLNSMDNYTDESKKNQEVKNNILEKCTEKKFKNPKFSNYIEPLISKKMMKLINECGDLLMFLSDFEMKIKNSIREVSAKIDFVQCVVGEWLVKIVLKYQFLWSI